MKRFTIFVSILFLFISAGLAAAQEDLAPPQQPSETGPVQDNADFNHDLDDFEKNMKKEVPGPSPGTKHKDPPAHSSNKPAKPIPKKQAKRATPKKAAVKKKPKKVKKKDE